MAEKELEYDIIVSGNKKLGSVWWDGDKIDSDEDAVLSLLSEQSYTSKLTMADGLEFLEQLPVMLRNGYVHAKRVKN